MKFAGGKLIYTAMVKMMPTKREEEMNEPRVSYKDFIQGELDDQAMSELFLEEDSEAETEAELEEETINSSSLRKRAVVFDD